MNTLSINGHEVKTIFKDQIEEEFEVFRVSASMLNFKETIKFEEANRYNSEKSRIKCLYYSDPNNTEFIRIEFFLDDYSHINEIRFFAKNTIHDEYKMCELLPYKEDKPLRVFKLAQFVLSIL